MKVVIAALAGRDEGLKAWTNGEICLCQSSSPGFLICFSSLLPSLRQTSMHSPLEFGWENQKSLKIIYHKVLSKEKPCGIYEDTLRCLCSRWYKLTQNKWQESVQVNYSYACLNHCFQSLGLCAGIWRTEEWDAFWEQCLFLQQTLMLWWGMLRTIACPGWTCSPSALTAAWLLAWIQSVPLQQGKWFWKLLTTRIACWSWGSSSGGPSPVLRPACCHSGLSAWASAEIHVTPQHTSTQVLSSASLMDSLGFVL